MELRQLQYVIKIAECGTMLKAAQELYISQSGLTRSLKTLEKELGMELFDRINNRLILNEYGKTVVEEENPRKITTTWMRVTKQY